MISSFRSAAFTVNTNITTLILIVFYSGEHSESAGGVYDISNKARLGLTEFEAVKQMYDGIKHLIGLEKKA